MNAGETIVDRQHQSLPKRFSMGFEGIRKVCTLQAAGGRAACSPAVVLQITAEDLQNRNQRSATANFGSELHICSANNG